MNFQFPISNFQKQGGQIVLVLTLLFVFISVSVILGLSVAAANELRNASDFMKSTASYYASESGVEDAIYRLKKSKLLDAAENLVLAGTYTVSAATTITDVAGGKEIVATGNAADALRKVKTKVAISDTDVSFNYGIQVGSEGLMMGNGAGVHGNVYANGAIVGGPTDSFITGDAIAANSAAAAPDQVNDTPATPTDSIVFGNASGSQDFAQSFQVSATGPVNKMAVYIKKTGSPGNLDVYIAADNGGVPSNTVIAQNDFEGSWVGTSYAWIEMPFDSNPDLIAGTTYWLVFDGGTNASKYYTVGANTAYTSGAGKVGQWTGTWNNTSPSGLDGYFKIYLGGVVGSIANIEVGEGGVGDAKAHTVTDSTIEGGLYCQTGSGNENESGGPISCDTSQPDPSPQPFAISDANIADWKADAEAGGTYSGNYTLDGTSDSFGPKKITGNLTIQNGATLTVTGTLWVEGDMLVDNNADIFLDSGYGAGSGVIIVDGKTTLSNNADFHGSGTSGSFLMLLSTSECPNAAPCGGANAIDVSNNVGAVLLDAHNGTLHFNNNADAKEATGRKIVLDNNAEITYDSGLVNVNFTSGPGGGFAVESWREVK